jgi:hypothetical protein
MAKVEAALQQRILTVILRLGEGSRQPEYTHCRKKEYGLDFR